MIDEIAAREKAATPGEWTVGTSTGVRGEPAHLTIVKEAPDKLTTRVIGQVFPHCDNYRLHRSTLEADADFIAHAREDIPYLLAQLKDREEKLAAVKKLASEAVCPGCMQKMDEACLDDDCNWGRQFLRILKGGE